MSVDKVREIQYTLKLLFILNLAVVFEETMNFFFVKQKTAYDI